MNIEELKKLKEIAGALIRKEDPQSGVSFEEDTVLAIPEVEQYNQQIYDLLDALLEGEYKELRRSEKKPFFLSKEQKQNVMISDEPVSISKFCYRINELIPGDMRKLRAVDLADELEEMGYLCTIEEENRAISRIPTEKGIALGIKTVERENQYQNKYLVNLYDKNAQQFILDRVHMNE